MYFPANVHDCICCIHHYIFVCIYNDVTVYGAVKSKSENTVFILSFWSSLTHRLRQHSPNSPFNVRAYLETEAEVPAHGWALPGSQATMARADETISYILGCEEDLSLQNCFIRQKKSWAAVWKSKGKAANEAALYPITFVSPPISLLIYPGTPGVLLVSTSDTSEPPS